MNLDELRSVQRTERQRDSLQNLRESFYADAATYIEGLKDERERAAERADDPFASPEVRRLTDEIGTAEEVVEAIYERRVGKVVKQATFAAADMPTDDEGLTAEEQRLFADLVDRIRVNRRAVLDMLAGETAPGSAAVSEGAVEEAPAGDGTDSPSATERASGADGSPVPDAESDVTSPTDDVLADAMGGGASDGGEFPGDPDPSDGADSPTLDRASEPGDDPPIPPDVDPQSDRSDADGAETESSRSPPSASPRPVQSDAPDSEMQAPDSTMRASDSETEAPEPATSTGASESPSSGAGGRDPTRDAPSDPVDTRDDARSDDTERIPLRITADVGRIVGVDEREYDLLDEDVVELPAANAEPLLRKQAAERLD